MEKNLAQAAPDGWRTITPRIVASDAAGLVCFICRLFEIDTDFERNAPTVLTIGDSKIMVSEVGERGPAPAFLYVYVPDVAEVYERAVALGATSIEAPFETPYGDRRCMVEDAWGNTWQIATQQGSAHAA